MTAAALALLFFAAQSYESVLQEGLSALARNDLAKAQTNLETAAALQPSHPEPWVGLALTYGRQGKPRQADEAAAKVEALAPADPFVLHGLASYYSQSAHLAQAEATLERVVKLRPFDETYYFELSQLYLKEQKFEPALRTLNAGVAVFDKSAQLELARGVALYGLRRFPEAIDSFLKTIQLAPEVPQPYLFLGRMLDQAESKLPEVARAFAGYRKANPQSYLGSFLTAKALLLQGGDQAEVERLLRESIQKNGDFWESHFELGQSLERKRDFAGAASELEAAVRLNPKDPTPHYRLARVYDRLGRSAQAAEQRELHARLTSANKAGMDR